MSFATMAIAAFGAAFSGFTALGLAMDRHYEDSFGRGRDPGRRRPWLQLGGAAGLALSLIACLAIAGMAQGWVLWCGVLTAGALAVVLVLSYAPQKASAAALAAVVGTLIAGPASLLLR